MTLKDLLKEVEILEYNVNLNLEFGQLRYNSNQVAFGDVFIAVKGYKTDGHQYIESAANKGALAIICQEKPTLDVPYILVADTRKALALASKNFFGNPTEGMVLIGVTGTCGKTSTTYLIRSIIQQALGGKVGLIGTNQNMIGETVIPTSRTTPESYEVYHLFWQMKQANCTHVVMEVTSHALELGRVYGTIFDVGVFTNLSQDHLDFHENMRAYCKAKAKLFDISRKCVYNADDGWAPQIIQSAVGQKLGYGKCGFGALQAKEVVLGDDYVQFEATMQNQCEYVRLDIPGEFMVYNALAAIGACLMLGIALPDIATALSAAKRVKGRLENVDIGDEKVKVFIDFAHTPTSLEKILLTAKGFSKGRVVVVCGCGGDRDKTKRPIMGHLATEIADFAILTSDNPRTENPRTIIEDMLVGITQSTDKYCVIENRREAIEWALRNRQAGDTILLCGKGHEIDQEINGVSYPFDEREIIKEIMAQI